MAYFDESELIWKRLVESVESNREPQLETQEFNPKDLESKISYYYGDFKTFVEKMNLMQTPLIRMLSIIKDTETYPEEIRGKVKEMFLIEFEKYENLHKHIESVLSGDSVSELNDKLEEIELSHQE